ncbi:MAG: thioredoxin-like domain-containing protein [Puniceicoccaceae bacterium]
MKISVLSLLLTVNIALAGFEVWTSDDGKTAELELIAVADDGEEKVGTFRTRDGQTVQLKASRLSAESAAKLNQWKPAGEAPTSVFDDILDGNLEQLEGKRLKSFKEPTRPQKYYVFYYTASWCPPCQKFTPSLVEWYNENKNDNFELVLISSDRDAKAMERYAAEKEMPWPQLRHKMVSDFKKEFQHGVKGIPSVIVCDLEGKNLGNFRSSLPRLTALVKD